MRQRARAHHHWREEYPEDVVEEQARQQDHASLHSAEGQVLDSLDRKCEPQHVVGQPVLAVLVPEAESQTEQATE